MALDDLERPSGITCPKYRKEVGSKRCQHFVSGGSCALPDEVLCVEFVKANPAKFPEYQHPLLPGTAPAIIPPKSPRQPAQQHTQPIPLRVIRSPNHEADAITQLVNDPDLAALVDRGLELQIEGWGDRDLWLVPSYTPQRDQRCELSYRDAATLANTLIPFPGAKVVSIRSSR